MTSDGAGHFRPRNFAVGFAALIAVWFGRVLGGGESFVLRDFGVFGYPLAHLHRAAFWNGDLPLWNPLSYCGIPWLAQWNTLTLYPGSLLYLLPPLPWSLNFYCLAHLWLAGFGMYLLARRLSDDELGATFAGVAYGLSGLVQNSLMWPNNIAAFAWAPVVLLTLISALEHGGRPLLVAILTGSLQMLAGAPEVILFTWFGGLVLTALKAGRRGHMVWLRFAVTVLGVSAICAIQLLPFLDLLRHSSRAENGAPGAWSLGGFGWINYYMPLFETRTKGTGVIYHATQAWTHSFYLGLPVIWLALLGLRSLPRRSGMLMSVVLLLSLFCAQSNQGGALGSVPPFNLIRFPVKFVIVWIIVLPLLTAFGIRALRDPRTPVRGTLGWVGSIGLISVSFVHANETNQLAPATVLANYGWRLAAGMIIITLLLSAMRRSPVRRGGFLASLGVLALDLLLHQPDLHPSIDARWFTEPNPAMADLDPATRSGHQRLHPVRSRQLQAAFNVDASLLEAFQLARVSMAMNWNLVEGSAKANGFFSLRTRSQDDIAEALFRDSEDLPNGLANFLGIQHLSAEENSFAWPTRHTSLPLVTAGREPRFADRAAILEQVVADDFDPRRTVWLAEASAPQLKGIHTTSATITNLVMLDEEISFTSHAGDRTIATVAVSWFPAWRAQVDGRPVEIHRANHGFMAVAVPAGIHLVELRYEDRAFAVGRWITLAALIALAIAWRRSDDQALPPKVT